MKGCGAEDENRGVDEESEAEGQRGIENGVVHGFAAVANGGTERAGLHDAGVEIKIVRHDRGAEDADGDVKHFAIAKNFRAGDEAHDGFAPNRAGEKDFVGKTASDGGDQRHDESLDNTEAAALKGQDDQNIEPGNKYAGEKRQAEEEFESHCGAENFREIASGDGNFANDPKRYRSPAGIMLAASLGQVAASGDAELGGERLKKHRHEIADENDAEQGVAKFRSSADVGRPVAGVHIAYRDKVSGAGKREDFANPRGGVRNGDGAIGLRQRGHARRA